MVDDPEGVRAVVREELRAAGKRLRERLTSRRRWMDLLWADAVCEVSNILEETGEDRAPREPAGEQIAESANCLPPGVPMGYREEANIRECPVCLGIGYFLGKDGGTLGAMRCSACDGRGYFFRTAAPSAQREKGEGT